MKKINVFIIDDSAIVRDYLTRYLSQDERINVVGSAIDPYVARDKIVKMQVDVITLDIELPRMDGLTFLKYLMKHYPIPVIIVSSLTDKENAASIKAMELGAIDIVPKPGGPFSVGNIIEELIEKIITASRVDFKKYKELVNYNINKSNGQQIDYLSKITTTNKLIAIGGSTGGTTALEIILKDFTKDFPATVVVIHMPPGFTSSFAHRLNEISGARVKEAQDGEIAMNGTVYLAPGNYHLLVERHGKDYLLRVKNGPKVHYQRPAVDVLFKSIAKNIGKNSIGILLTGMGKDGAEGLLSMHNQGAFTIAQDEKSCIVFGMPKEAINLGAADLVLPLQNITRNIVDKLLLPMS